MHGYPPLTTKMKGMIREYRNNMRSNEEINFNGDNNLSVFHDRLDRTNLQGLNYTL